MLSNDLLKDSGFTMTGRTAAAFYGLCSMDDNVIFLESDVFDDEFHDVDDVVFTNTVATDLPVTYDKRGRKYAHIFKAAYDTLTCLYDDSIEEDVIEGLQDLDIIENFKAWLKENNLEDKLNV